MTLMAMVVVVVVMAMVTVTAAVMSRCPWWGCRPAWRAGTVVVTLSPIGVISRPAISDAVPQET